MNDAGLVVEAALSGMGLACTLESNIRQELAQGRLIRVREDSALRPRGFYIYYPSGRVPFGGIQGVYRLHAEWRTLLEFGRKERRRVGRNRPQSCLPRRIPSRSLRISDWAFCETKTYSKNRFSGRGSPRLSRKVGPSYSARKMPRRCSSGTTFRTKSSRPAGR